MRFDKFNAVRNDHSAAHPNEMLNKAEAMYAVKIISETLSFLDKIESIKDSEQRTEYPWKEDDTELDDSELPF